MQVVNFGRGGGVGWLDVQPSALLVLEVPCFGHAASCLPCIDRTSLAYNNNFSFVWTTSIGMQKKEYLSHQTVCAVCNTLLNLEMEVVKKHKHFTRLKVYFMHSSC